MLRRTLTFRLVATSIVWVVGSLVAAGVLLVFLFRDHIERRFDQGLYDHLQELVAAGEVAADGAFALTWIPADPRFDRPLSGWYWQISRSGEVVARSASLWQDRIPVPMSEPGTPPRIGPIVGPGDEPLRVLVQDITFPESDDHFAFAVAGPVSDIQADVDRFVTQLTVTLGVLGLGLLVAVLVQVRFGLRPLRAMQGALADIRAGRIQRLPETFPEEIEGVVHELNALLDHNALALERYRTQTGNLAHALKNPLTVIRNEIVDIEGEKGEILKEQAIVVSDVIDRYLSRARIAGSGDVLGARTSVATSIENLKFSMDRLYEGRGLDISVKGIEGLQFQGDADDLEEMLGNLMDNACKWARSRVVVSGRRVEGGLRIAVEDDGPGIPEERRAEVLKRGRRLDETMPGSGLGLDIVQDIAEIYGGSIQLNVSSIGGLRVDLELPIAG
jgi:signal transduction histidine kinase